MKKQKRLIAAMTFLFMVISLISKNAFAYVTTCKVIFDDGIHYMDDPNNVNEDIVVYCMNNELVWPHLSENGQQIPDYTHGYLKPEDIKNYDEMIKKLKKILLMGYPYNGMRLYEIIENKENYVPSEDEFNEMLKPDSLLVDIFPELGHHKFTIDNFNEKKDVLSDFFYNVFMMKESNTSDSLTKSDILVNPFYKAVTCLINFDDPLHAFAYIYSDSYYVTEKEAYENTQSAVWKLLSDYGVPNNNLNDISNYKLGEIFLQYANSNNIILTEEPLSNEIKIKGDFRFTQGNDGKWYSGKFRIEEPNEYNGMYILDLPTGISLINGSEDNIYGNEDYFFVSDHMPDSDEEFQIWSNIMWAKDPIQYSPLGDIEYKGKKYQKMTGLYVNRTHLSCEFTYDNVSVGDLKVINKVSGDAADTTKDFTYKVTLSNNTINGKYGDMEFEDGVSTFTLKDNESIMAIGLPTNIEYTVVKSDDYEYQVTSINSNGKIEANKVISVEFTNVKNPKPVVGDLKVTNKVSGNAADTTKDFTYTVTLSDTTINGTYGEMVFINGVSTFTLKDNESIEAIGLPTNIEYTVVESDNDGYQVTSSNSNGKIEANKVISVEFTNEKNSIATPPPTQIVGDLKLTIKVLGNAADTTKDFTYTVTLSDKTIDGKYGDMEFKNGVSAFTLKHNENIEAIGLPANITYTISESDNDEYQVTSINSHGKVEANNMISVEFINVKNLIPTLPPTPVVGDLKITNKVLGISADITKDFEYTVTLSDNTINGKYGDMEFKNGVSSFTLKNNKSIKAIGLPANITYTVVESDNDGYQVTSINSNGKIETNDVISVEFINVKNLIPTLPPTPAPNPNPNPTPVVGDLEVTSKVLGNLVDPTKDFTYTVTLSDNTINGKYGDMEFKNGISTFTLKNNKSIKAIGLPANITYTVIESDNDEYEVTSINSNGKIEATKMIEVEFVHVKNVVLIPRPTPAVGDLKVTNKVLENVADTTKDFTYTVTLSDNTIDGKYGNMEFKNGVSSFTLKNNESIEAIGLPVNIEYTVIESDNDGYQVTSINSNGKIEANKEVSVKFINVKNSIPTPPPTPTPNPDPTPVVGDLKVTNKVSGNAADTTKDFTYTVTLSDNTINGKYGNMEFKNGISTFTLKDNESIVAIGLPINIEYTVVESDNDEYQVTSINSNGKIEANKVVSVEFTNVKNSTPTPPPTPEQNPTPTPPPTPIVGDLKVTNKVLGNAADTTKYFTYIVTLSDNTIDGKYGNMEFKNGVSSFTLKNNESIEAIGLPVNIEYTVIESDNDGYQVTSINSNGKIEANKVVSVEFTNVKNSTPIIDNQENIVNNNKPTNSPIISDKEDINQNTTNKLPTTGKTNFALVGILMILGGMTILKDKNK